MPLYEYQCQKCFKISEQYSKLDSVRDMIPCPNCGNEAHKIISNVAIQNVEPKWLDDQVRGAVQDDDEPPIRDRQDLQRVVKEKGLIERG